MSTPLFSDSSEVLKFIKDTDVKFLDIRFTDLPGIQQHFNIPASTVDEEFFSVGQLFDGSSIRGFQSIHESDLQLIPDISTAYVDPFRTERTLIIVFDIYNPRNGEIYAPRPAPGRQEGREVPRLDRHRRHRVLRARGRVLHLRRRALRGEAEQELTTRSTPTRPPGTRGRVEEGGNLANKTPYKGGYFPVTPGRQARRPARRHHAQADRRRPRGRARPPRGRHRRPGRDQLQVRHDGARGRRHPEVQVHRQEHRARVGQGRDLHAEAAHGRQRLGHAHPPVAVERRQAAVLRREGLRRTVATSPAGTSAAS